MTCCILHTYHFSILLNLFSLFMDCLLQSRVLFFSFCISLLCFCWFSDICLLISFFMSNFSYCTLTWHFCCEQNTVKIEKIQEHALHFIYDDYKSTYEFLLDKSKLLSLMTHRIHTIALNWRPSKLLIINVLCLYKTL